VRLFGECSRQSELISGPELAERMTITKMKQIIRFWIALVILQDLILMFYVKKTGASFTLELPDGQQIPIRERDLE